MPGSAVLGAPAGAQRARVAAEEAARLGEPAREGGGPAKRGAARSAAGAPLGKTHAPSHPPPSPIAPAACRARTKPPTRPARLLGQAALPAAAGAPRRAAQAQVARKDRDACPVLGPWAPRGPTCGAGRGLRARVDGAPRYIQRRHCRCSAGSLGHLRPGGRGGARVPLRACSPGGVGEGGIDWQCVPQWTFVGRGALGRERRPAPSLCLAPARHRAEALHLQASKQQQNSTRAGPEAAARSGAQASGRGPRCFSPGARGVARAAGAPRGAGRARRGAAVAADLGAGWQRAPTRPPRRAPRASAREGR